MARGKLFSDEERAFISAAVKKGMSFNLIAEQLGRTQRGVGQQAAAMGLRSRCPKVGVPITFEGKRIVQTGKHGVRGRRAI